MALSNDLISSFVKTTNDKPKTKTETTLYGTVVIDSAGTWVRIDGSPDGMLTKLPDAMTTDGKTVKSYTTVVANGDRVMVTIKNNTAVVTGNLTNPSADNGTVEKTVNDVKSVSDKVDNINTDNLIVNQKLTALEADISTLSANDVIIDGKLTALEGDISTLTADNVTINDKLTATEAKIETIEADNITIHNRLVAMEVVVESIDAVDLTAIQAIIQDLQANVLTAETADLRYANIDFANITDAALTRLYSQTGLINNLTISDGVVTGELTGVTINGDMINANTLKANRLLIQGEDGLYYRLNTDGVKTEVEQTPTNSLNGSVILANSITASKISVDDLVAFNATIGGINITSNSIYSGAKSSVLNTTTGLYLDSTGQVSFGDSSNFIRYFLDKDGSYKLQIAANSIIFGAGDLNIESIINEIQASVDANGTRLDSYEEETRGLANMIATLVTDSNGTSLMTQTESGWTFNIQDTADSLASVSESVDNIQATLDDTANNVNILQQTVSDIGEITKYVVISATETQPYIELGTENSDFKLRITNEDIRFMEGTNVPAYINNNTLYIYRAVIQNELQQGKFMWKVRANGNMGLTYRG